MATQLLYQPGSCLLDEQKTPCTPLLYGRWYWQCLGCDQAPTTAIARGVAVHLCLIPADWSNMPPDRGPKWPTTELDVQIGLRMEVTRDRSDSIPLVMYRNKCSATGIEQSRSPISVLTGPDIVDQRDTSTPDHHQQCALCSSRVTLNPNPNQWP